jgi:hypothetical protein
MYAQAVKPLVPASLCINALVATMLSPSKNPCMIRVPSINGVSRYRNDPYRALVLPQGCVSPVAAPMPTSRMVMPAAAAPRAPPAIASVDVVLPPAAMAVQAPAAPLSTSVENTANKLRFVNIKFKCETMFYTCSFKVEAGDVVVCQGDRGENIGTVMEASFTKPSFNVPMRIIRHATAAEKESLRELRAREATATRICQQHADSFGLPMKIVDCEYQADYQKLTIFFSAKQQVDFRKLQRVLFKEFRCRIWLMDW